LQALLFDFWYIDTYTILDTYLILDGENVMEMKSVEFSIALILSILFTIALLYATLEVPVIVHRYLLEFFPDYWWEFLKRIEALRPFGYISFIATLVLILAGFIIRQMKISILGSIALYLPTFGYFAFAMFFLAGIGVLRLLWLPLLDLCPTILRLGDVIYLPCFLLALPLLLIAWTFRLPLTDLRGLNIPPSLIIMALGLIIFLLGVFTWLYGRFRRIRIIDFWIYRYSRHPQYFGFLLWSYGLTILASTIGAQRGGYVPPPSLPWLISTLIIVGVALHEENVMARMYGDEYVRYRNCTPFMLPLPKQISNLVTLPMKKLLGKSRPENGREIASTILLYSIILILLSTPLIPLLKI